MGVRLLNRGRQGIEPTPHGRVLIERSRTIFDELRQGLNEIEYLSDPTAGELRIAASVPTAAGHGKRRKTGGLRRPPMHRVCITVCCYVGETSRSGGSSAGSC